VDCGYDEPSRENTQPSRIPENDLRAKRQLSDGSNPSLSVNI
jgi:hypothetical protein